MKLTFKSFSNPILFVSDNPSLPGGLSRLGRDVSILCATMPEYRVGYLGRGLGQNRKLPYTVYDYPESGQWGENYIQQAWDDLSGGDDGIIITLDDLSRRHWFVNTVGLSPALTKFLGPGCNFKRVAYTPVDSVGPNGTTLPWAITDCAKRYDKVYAASEWGKDALQASGCKADWLPHGFFSNKFHPTRMDDVGGVVVGCVMANQSRKDYPAAFECFAILRAKYGNKFKAWLHVDEMIRYWNVYALATDYGVSDCLEVTQDLQDNDLAHRYSACHCTILPTGGEGFGYPIAESMACGTACVVTDYAAGPELVDPMWRVKPVTYRVDSPHNTLRAVNSGTAFANAVVSQVEQKRNDWEYRSGQIASMVDHLDWSNLKHLWVRELRGLLK